MLLIYFHIRSCLNGHSDVAICFYFSFFDSQAYEDLEKIFKETEDGDSDVYTSKVELVEAIAKEKNANAFAAGVASVRIFMEKSSNAGQIALPVAEATVTAGFKQAKAKIVEACRKVGSELGLIKCKRCCMMVL